MNTDEFLLLPQDDDNLHFQAVGGESSPGGGTGTATYSSAGDDELYLERLQALYEKQIGEIHAFARREGRAYKDVQKTIARWYSQTLFDSLSNPQDSVNHEERNTKLSTIMRMISDALESLEVVSGHQSFFLIVNPNDESDQGFLGGTILGREFWRGHRGCGAAGALAFNLFCQKAAHPNVSNSSVAGTTHVLQQPQPVPTQPIGIVPYPTHPHGEAPKKNLASTVKAEVYASVRNAIRTVTGRRNAEMKWSNHERLVEAYGVRLEGWPPSVPKQNPSTLSVTQNKEILQVLQNGSMRFVSVKSTTLEPRDRGTDDANAKAQREKDIFEDTVDFSAGLGEGEMSEGGRIGSSPEFVVGSSHNVSERSLNLVMQHDRDAVTNTLSLPMIMAAREDGNNGASFEPVSNPMSLDAKVRDEEDSIGIRKRRRMEDMGDNVI
ncbi:hypothetical protein BDY19DRAFT_689234 [Irpex rosettiformis]|uniref:Uncharacterized protein n=1 Tax=Irpex rosettiformis TaxID=378272 RepID=A0ACB8U9Y1_9APHY|nr:hypothetical protein BDY19DRAFT_689234 [Irpex rosettiformis]